MFGFKFKLEPIYFVAFRKTNNSSYLSSYSLPPFTTIRGLISNALGINRDNYLLQDIIKIGIVVNNYNYCSELTKLLKLKNEERKTNRFPSSPVYREFLVNSSYDIFIGGEEDIISKINYALINPKRDLFIGSSDDLVDLDVNDYIEISKGFDVPKSIIGGIHENCVIEKIPYKFHKEGKKFNLEEKIISIPNKNFSDKVDVYKFYNENVVLF